MALRAQSKVVAVILVAAAGHVHGSVCKLARYPLGLLPYFVEARPNAEYVTEIAADFDGDKKNDLLRWLPQDAGSVVPADLASVTLTLSSSSKVFTVEETYVSVLQYRSRYFIVATALPDERKQQKTVLYSVGRSGFRRLCVITKGENAR